MSYHIISSSYHHSIIIVLINKTWCHCRQNTSSTCPFLSFEGQDSRTSLRLWFETLDTLGTLGCQCPLCLPCSSRSLTLCPFLPGPARELRLELGENRVCGAKSSSLSLSLLEEPLPIHALEQVWRLHSNSRGAGKNALSHMGCPKIITWTMK